MWQISLLDFMTQERTNSGLPSHKTCWPRHASCLEWNGKLSSRPTLTIIERAGRLACKVQLSSRGLRSKAPEVHVKKLFSLYNVTVWIQGAAQRYVATLQISVGALWQDSTPCSRSSTSSSRLAAGNENSASEWLNNICIASATWTESLTWMMKKTS